MRNAITDSLNWCLFLLLAGRHCIELHLEGFMCNRLRHLPVVLYQAIKVEDREDTLSLYLVFFSLSSHYLESCTQQCHPINPITTPPVISPILTLRLISYRIPRTLQDASQCRPLLDMRCVLGHRPRYQLPW